VLCKSTCLSLGAVDLAEDLGGALGPGKWVRVIVPTVDEGTDDGDEVLDRCEGAAADGLAGDDAEEDGN
jgi:hypothetical protein